MTSKDIALEYGAEWVPVDRSTPIAGELVEVLYADGVACRAKLASDGGKIFLMESGGMYRYVAPIFWRPVSD